MTVCVSNRYFSGKELQNQMISMRIRDKYSLGGIFGGGEKYEYSSDNIVM